MSLYSESIAISVGKQVSFESKSGKTVSQKILSTEKRGMAIGGLNFGVIIYKEVMEDRSHGGWLVARGLQRFPGG